MVEEADDMCELLSYDGTHTRNKACKVNIVSDKMPKGWFRIEKQDSTITGGAHYEVDLIAAILSAVSSDCTPLPLLCWGSIPIICG